MSKILVVLSGGQDSTTCLFYAKRVLAKDPGSEVHALTFNYGQRHVQEIDAARRVVHLASVHSHEILTLPAILKGTSPLVSGAQLEQYADHDALPGGIEKTFVPMRNAFFLTVAANRAVVLGADVILTGVSEEDYGGYPDCRETFLAGMSNMIELALGESVQTPPAIRAPLLHLSKAETVRFAQSLSGCYHAMAFTHTAYDGMYPPKGKDHASLLRVKGFLEAGVPDPLILRAVDEKLMPLPQAPNYEALADVPVGHLLEFAVETYGSVESDDARFVE